jgi:hypothetical protein
LTPQFTDEDLLARQAAFQDRTLDEFAAWLAARGPGQAG